MGYHRLRNREAEVPMTAILEQTRRILSGQELHLTGGGVWRATAVGEGKRFRVGGRKSLRVRRRKAGTLLCISWTVHRCSSALGHGIHSPLLHGYVGATAPPICRSP